MKLGHKTAEGKPERMILQAFKSHNLSGRCTCLKSKTDAETARNKVLVCSSVKQIRAHLRLWATASEASNCE